MGLKLAAASGGSIELNPTNTASNFIVTVPAVTATMLTNATTTGFPAGSVLQVVQATTTTLTNTTSTTFADTSLSASITPTSASSKILVIVSQLMVVSRQTNVYNAVQALLLRDSTTIQNAGRVLLLSAGVSGNGFWELAGRVNLTYLDSPSTTSSVTYKTQFAVEVTANSGAASAQPQSSPSTITLMEIAA
jgi:hypothetical protein